MLPPFMGVEPSGMPLLLGWKAICASTLEIVGSSETKIGNKEGSAQPTWGQLEIRLDAK
jgi:hypothetical protein